MKKKTEIPTNNPLPRAGNSVGQRPQTNSKEDIRKKTTDKFNSNNGPQQHSHKKSF